MSNVFKRDAADSARLTDVVAGYVGVRSWTYLPSAIKTDQPEVDDAGYRAAEMLANGKSRAAYDLAAAMARKYPDDAQALLQFSAFSTFNYWALQQDEVAPAMRAARTAAERVAVIAPDFGDIYPVLASLMPPQHWAQREALLRKGLATDPDTQFAGHALSGLLGERLKKLGLPSDHVHVELGMRYGEPSIAAALDALKKGRCERILVLPLYPQYAASTTASAQDAVFAALQSVPTELYDAASRGDRRTQHGHRHGVGGEHRWLRGGRDREPPHQQSICRLLLSPPG
jgi:hypothetical protein